MKASAALADVLAGREPGGPPDDRAALISDMRRHVLEATGLLELNKIATSNERVFTLDDTDILRKALVDIEAALAVVITGRALTDLEVLRYGRACCNLGYVARTSQSNRIAIRALKEPLNTVQAEAQARRRTLIADALDRRGLLKGRTIKPAQKRALFADLQLFLPRQGLSVINMRTLTQDLDAMGLASSQKQMKPRKKSEISRSAKA